MYIKNVTSCTPIHKKRRIITKIGKIYINSNIISKRKQAPYWSKHTDTYIINQKSTELFSFGLHSRFFCIYQTSRAKGFGTRIRQNMISSYYKPKKLNFNFFPFIFIPIGRKMNRKFKSRKWRKRRVYLPIHEVGIGNVGMQSMFASDKKAIPTAALNLSVRFQNKSFEFHSKYERRLKIWVQVSSLSRSRYYVLWT